MELTSMKTYSKFIEYVYSNMVQPYSRLPVLLVLPVVQCSIHTGIVFNTTVPVVLYSKLLQVVWDPV